MTPPGSLAATPPPSAPAASPGPSASITLPITTTDQAAALVLASDARFTGIGPRDPAMIGGCCWYAATATGDGGFQVAIHLGWGDCPSGCINKHDWLYAVTADGTVSLDRESGDEIQAGAGGGAGPFGDLPPGPGIAGLALAGPICPVVQPGGQGCKDRPVVGAEFLIRASDGTVVADVTSDDKGLFTVPVPPGAYQVEPQPVTGLMGTAAKVVVTVGAAFQTVTVTYDTGIR
jgi:hypothetical protein